MHYRSYSAKIEFDRGYIAFHGHVIGINDVVHFEGVTVAGHEIVRHLKESAWR